MPLNDKYILYADDDQDDQELLHDVMHEVVGGLTVRSVHNGIEIIDFLSKIPKGEAFPSLILMDLNMPVVGGYQALKMLKLNPTFSQIPVVVFSTSNLVEDKRKSLWHGAVDFITKPMFYREVVDVCRKLVELCGRAPVVRMA